MYITNSNIFGPEIIRNIDNYSNFIETNTTINNHITTTQIEIEIQSNSYRNPGIIILFILFIGLPSFCVSCWILNSLCNCMFKPKEGCCYIGCINYIKNDYIKEKSDI